MNTYLLMMYLLWKYSDNINFVYHGGYYAYYIYKFLKKEKKEETQNFQDWVLVSEINSPISIVEDLKD